MLTHSLLLATLVWFPPDVAQARRADFTGDGVVSGVTKDALDGKAPELDSIRGELLKNKDLVEAHAQDEILRHARFRELRGFYIDYQSFRCVSAPRLDDARRAIGSCVGKAHAYQVTADVAVTVTASGIRVEALSTVVD